MNYPFKFNRAWLPTDEFSHVVHSSWTSETNPSGGDDMHRLVIKLKILKLTFKIWEKIHKQSQRQELIDIGHDIQQIFSLFPFGIFPEMELQKLVSIRKMKE